MSDPTLIADLIRAGVSPKTVARVIDILAPFTGVHLSTFQRAESGPGPHTVYGLVDPRDGKVFYVGITANRLSYRVYCHSHDPISAAWPRIQELKKLSLELGVHILAEYPSRDQAWEHEHRLIHTLPGLVNRDHRRYHLYKGG